MFQRVGHRHVALPLAVLVAHSREEEGAGVENTQARVALGSKSKYNPPLATKVGLSSARSGSASDVRVKHVGAMEGVPGSRGSEEDAKIGAMRVRT